MLLMGHLCILYFHLSESHSRVQRGTRTDAALIGWLQSQLHRCEYAYSFIYALAMYVQTRKKKQTGNDKQAKYNKKTREKTKRNGHIAAQYTCITHVC